MSTTTTITHPDGTVVTCTTSSLVSPKMLTYYTMTGAPNPQIVDLAAAELGIDIASVKKEVDLPGMENRSPEMLKKNPAGGLPFVELEGGDCIAETMAICELFETMPNNGKTLLGTTAVQQANTRMWQRRVEQQICIPLMSAFRWGKAKDFFAKRGHHGLTPSDEAAEQQMTVVKDQLKWLNDLMGSNAYICGDEYTLADVTLFG